MRQYTRQTIKRNFFAAMLLAPFIPVLLALGTGGYLFWNHVQQGALSRLTLLSTGSARVVDLFLDDFLGDLTMAQVHLSEHPDSNGLRTVFDRLSVKHKRLVDVALVDPDGLVKAYVGPSVYTGTHIVPGQWLDEALQRGSSVSGVISGQMGLPHCIVALRLTSGDEPLILRASLDLEIFAQMLMDVRGGATELFLVNREGEVIAGSGGQILTRERGLVEHVFMERVGTAFHDSPSDTAYSSVVLRHGGWILAARKHMGAIFSATDSTALFLGMSLLSAGIVVFLSSLYLTGYVEKMLRQRDEEREVLREQLYRAGRLAELGEMAAGFAHEINNPLQIMKSDQAYMEMLLQDFRDRAASDADFLGDVNEMAASINQLKLQIDRCARITHSILSFGRAGNSEAQNIDLGKFIPEVLTMIQKKIQLSNIALHVDMPDSRLLVHVDPARLQQVLLNLLNNAMYAVSEVSNTRPGEIVLSCSAEGADQVRVEIRDNGSGIGVDQQKLIFTPFYTTKPAGSGTGLGLSLCHGIVESMKGVLDFTSVKGQGSAFFLLLPRVTSSTD
ncbi:MAG: ATP-binding protein [Desulfomicrobium apsheronum]|nr:ATP-binding protein [Desulfomicrobium apsheronum]